MVKKQVSRLNATTTITHPHPKTMESSVPLSSGRQLHVAVEVGHCLSGEVTIRDVWVQEAALLIQEVQCDEQAMLGVWDLQVVS